MEPSFYQAPVATKQPFLSHRMLLIVIALAVAMLLAIVFLILASRSGPGDLYARAIAREQALLALVDNAQSEISNQDLSKISADAELFANSDITNLTAQLGTFGKDEVPKNIAATELANDGAAELEQAKLENRFDQTYKQLLLDKIDSQLALLKNLYDQAKNTKAKAAINHAYFNLTNLQKELTALSL